MPGAFSGLDLAEFVYRSMGSLPVIVTSGDGEGADCSLPDGSLFIPKPYPIARMIELLVSSKTENGLGTSARVA
ncbi:hypothetical protein [Rhizobium wenxiniae]|uniref:hypothetical protein n=1 Tax=Rhizobium wenxiniae TaxID=1737357 RepID=UPI001C6EE932|nr:hypothetical protein [Rhizobium wenxiniae]